MSEIDKQHLERFASDLESLGKQLRTNAKAMLGSATDPFACLQNIDRSMKLLEENNLTNEIAVLRQSIEKECLEATAEFWQRFCAVANDVGWEVVGSTDRRLVSRAFFVELKNKAITIEGLPGRHTPHVPALIQTLKPQIDQLSEGDTSIQSFVDLLVRAYDLLGGRGDIGVEGVFRQCVLLIQPSTFWTSVERSRFRSLPRPTFRYWLSKVLAENAKATDGRQLRLMPTLNRRDVWELFSPAEGRVVQVGRLAFKSE